MDPVTAVAVSGNVIQFVEFSLQLVSKGYRIYKSADGALAENDTVGLFAADCKRCSARLLQSLKAPGPVTSTSGASSTLTLVAADDEKRTIPDRDEEMLREICQACIKLSEQLQYRLERLKVRPGTSHRQWKSARQALKSVWSKAEIDAVALQLKNYRDLMMTNVLVSLRDYVNRLGIDSATRFDRLDYNSGEILKAVWDNRSTINGRLEVFSDNLSRLVISENQKTRGMFTEYLTTANTTQVVVDYDRKKSPSVSQDLHEIVRQGDLRSLRALFRSNKADYDVNALNDAGQSALHLACTNGHVDVVRFLLRQGARLNVEDDMGMTPLHCAAKAGSETCFWSLLRSGAEKAVEDDNGYAPGDYARGNFIISWMLKWGDPVESRESRRGRTALIQASADGAVSAVKYLLTLPAIDINDGDFHDETALRAASNAGHLGVVELLVSAGADINNKGHDDWTALLGAVCANHLEVVQYLVQKGADLEARLCHGGGHTSLAEAVWKGHWEIAQFLVGRGANINAKDVNGHTLLIKASIEGRLEIAREALKHGAGVDMIDNSGMTALHHASTEGHSELIKALLDAGANIRARTRHKTYTPLLTAAQFGRSTAVQVLLAHGADVNDLNAEKWSALVEAANHNYVEIARIVLTHGANVDVPSENFEPDRTRVTAVTPLMRAAGNGHLLLLGILLDYGADVALKDSRGYTALAFAVKEMQENTARALLERGADIKGLSALGERSNWLSRKLEEEFSV